MTRKESDKQFAEDLKERTDHMMRYIRERQKNDPEANESALAISFLLNRIVFLEHRVNDIISDLKIITNSD